MITTEQEIVRNLVGTLNQMPDSHAQVTIGSHPGWPDYDARIEGKISGKNITLLVEAKRNVYPRDVHQYLSRARSMMQRAKCNLDDNLVLLLAAHSISPGAKELLREEHCAYFDAGGRLYVASNGLLVDRERPPAPSEARAIGSLFTGTRARVLLTRPISSGLKQWRHVLRRARCGSTKVRRCHPMPRSVVTSSLGSVWKGGRRGCSNSARPRPCSSVAPRLKPEATVAHTGIGPSPIPAFGRQHGHREGTR